MPSQVLLFDVMDTLVVDPFWDLFPELFGEPLDALMRQTTPDAWPRFERAEIDEATWLRTAFRDGRPIDREQLRAALTERYRFIDGIEELLEQLRLADVEMHLFSNYPVWYRMLEEKLGLTRFAPWTFVSWETGLRKPDEAAYRRAVEELGRPAEDLIFIDDRDRNCAGARAVGIDAVLFEGTDSLRRSLVERGVVAG